MARLRAMALDAGVPTFERQTEALLHRPDAQAVLPTIDCALFAIVGRDDEWSPVAQHQAIAQLVRGAQLRVIEGAGHMSPAEDPERFNEIVREWLCWPPR